MRLSWRAIVSPEALLLLGAVQANLPYVLWRYYPVCDRYPVRISYEVLPLWGWAYGAFVLGAVHVSTCMVRRRREDRGLPYKVDGGRFRLALIVVLGAFGVQLCMACILYGVIPLVAYFRGFHVATLNLLQERSAFGQLGLLMLTRFVLNALIIVGFVGPQEMHQAAENFFGRRSFSAYSAGSLRARRRDFFCLSARFSLAVHWRGPLPSSCWRGVWGSAGRPVR